MVICVTIVTAIDKLSSMLVSPYHSPTFSSTTEFFIARAIASSSSSSWKRLQHELWSGDLLFPEQR